MKTTALKTKKVELIEIDTEDLQKYIAYCYNLEKFQIWSELDGVHRKIFIDGMDVISEMDRSVIHTAIQMQEIESEHIRFIMQDLRNKQYISDGVYLLDITW